MRPPNIRSVQPGKLFGAFKASLAEAEALQVACAMDNRWLLLQLDDSGDQIRSRFNGRAKRASSNDLLK